jgi:PAS domain S-box-containing protein
LQALSQTTRAFAEATLDYDRLLETIPRKLAEVIKDGCILLVPSDDGLSLVPVAIHATNDAATRLHRELLEAAPIRLDQRSVSATVFRTGVADLVSKVDLSSLGERSASAYVEFVRKLGAHSFLVVALRVRGTSVGVLSLYRYGAESPAFDERDLEMAEVIADHAALALDNARLIASRRLADRRFERLSEVGVVGILVSDVRGHVTEINDTLLSMVGFTRPEILSGAVPWPSLTAPGFQEVDRRAIADLGSTGCAGLREKVYVRKDGVRVPVMIGSAALEGDGGSVISFVVDLTEREAAHAAIEALRAQSNADAMFRNFLLASHDGILLVDGGGDIVFANPKAEQLFGHTQRELLGTRIETLVPDHHRGRSDDPAMGVCAELLGFRKDGTAFPLEITLAEIEGDGRVLVSATIRDLTDRNAADGLRRRLAALVEASDDAIIGKTPRGIITSWNGGAGRLFGYSAAEVVGRSVMILLPPERAAEEAEILAHLADGRVEHRDTVRLHKDGHAIPVSVTVSPILDSTGRLIGASKVARDISERRRSEAALERAKDTAEAATRELEAFSYSVAHDLRAPLRGMNGFARVLVDKYRGQLDANAQDWLQEILLNARKLGELIDALLALARLTKSTLRRETVDLSAVFRDVAASLAAAEPDRSVELLFQEAVRAEVDPVLARALAENLLGNAWKFTRNVPVARISFGVTDGAAGPTYFVRDNGAGFDMAFAGKLFAPFQRLHTVDEFPGTGIGLATVQRIVHRHGGRVWAEGAVDAGATFHFTLPTPPQGAP